MTVRKYLPIISVTVTLLVSSLLYMPVYGAPQRKSTDKTKQTSAKTTTSKGATAKGSTQKATPAKNSAGKNTTASKGKKTETSADVKKRQEATQKEIRQTEQQIKENDRSIKKGLSDLGKIEGDISSSKQKIAATAGKISQLSGEISSLEASIASNEKELMRLREEYLKAVKKMRIARKQKSDLAFVFASENFNQALRRMRYLRQFSEWKDRQTAAIDAKTSELKKQQATLAEAKNEQDAALRQQQTEEATLRQQFAKQDAIVAGLRKNGEALKSHLSKKQAEANQLRSRISALIAEEQRKAEEERRRKEQARIEAERKAEAARIAKAEADRKAAAEKAEKERLAAEKRAASKAAAKATEEEQVRLAQVERDKAKKNAVKEATKPAATVKQASKTSPETQRNSGSYADARQRKPRSNTYTTTSKEGNAVPKNVPGVSKAETSTVAKAANASTVGGNFAGMKGSLPRPVSGAFRITSRFGRQSLPDLPDVVYDNPGIDAETAAGAAALAVFQGKVSGVYMIPGYHTVVIVNHGNYYTVYGNISSPSVKVGDAVNAGQRLGALAPDDDDRNHSSIHFEVWRNREKLNPQEWLR